MVRGRLDPVRPRSDPADPSTLHDVFSRIGGSHLGKTALPWS